jgi:hypothetical protein
MKCPVCKEGKVKKVVHPAGPLHNVPGSAVSPFPQTVYRHLDDKQKSCIDNKYASKH